MITEAAQGAVGLAVVDPDPIFCADVAGRLPAGTTPATYSGVAALVDGQPAGRPLLVIFGPGLADPAGLGEIERFTRSRPETGAILVAAELSTALLQQALRAGVKDVLGAPADTGSLAESLARVAESLPGHPTLGPGGAGGGPERCRTVTVFSMKGGSGKTVVATNLAVLLAQRSSRPVALVDADLQFGDVTVVIRLHVPHTIADAVPAIDRLDADLLRSLMVTHEESGLLVLPAPLEPSLADRIAAADVLKILEVLQSFCSYVVIDTPSQFNDVVLGVIEASDEIVVVVGMEVPNIKNAKLGLQTLRRLGIPEQKLRLLINRANSKVQLDVAEVERTLGLRAQARIPSDIVVPQAVNRGIPVVLDARRSDVTRAFEQLADLFLSPAADVPMKKARGRFGR